MNFPVIPLVYILRYGLQQIRGESVAGYIGVSNIESNHFRDILAIIELKSGN